jgi:hypothetical protein
MKSNRYEPIPLHFTERNLIALIRKLRVGELTIKAQDGLPMVAEIHNKQKVILNQEIENDNP